MGELFLSLLEAGSCSAVEGVYLGKEAAVRRAQSKPSHQGMVAPTREVNPAWLLTLGCGVEPLRASGARDI